MKPVLLLRVLLALPFLAASGCVPEGSESDLVWAVNVGGEQFVAADGTTYRAEEFVRGGDVGWQEEVKGSQDAFIYRSYREGDVELAYPVANGRYDVTLKFTEPRDLTGGERVFDAFAENRRIVDDLDIMSFRDGKTRSALSVTVPDVSVEDGELNIDFHASSSRPVLSAVVVRLKNRNSPAGKLLWADEFDVDGEPDADKWTVDVWPSRKVNDEDQTYTGRPKNLRVEGGLLIIEAHKEDYRDAEYTSGRIHSNGKGDFLYGRFEVRARLPAGKGTWPAIWMLPSDPYRYSTSCEDGEDWQGSGSCDAWPNSGEIDIMEHVGYQMNHVHGTVHNQAYYWAKWEQRKGRILSDGVDSDFHVYALEWTPEEIRVFMDNILYFVYVNEQSGWESWPYDHPFHVILNVAVGGMWGRSGGGIDDGIFPQRMEVDYVRIYEGVP